MNIGKKYKNMQENNKIIHQRSKILEALLYMQHVFYIFIFFPFDNYSYCLNIVFMFCYKRCIRKQFLILLDIDIVYKLYI
jgi:phosphoketolase